MRGEDMTPETLDWGVKAGIVPGNFGGYLIALTFRHDEPEDVSASAIEYAERGYPIDPSLATGISRAAKRLGAFPTTAKIFMPGGRAPTAGELFRNPDLAATLRKPSTPRVLRCRSTSRGPMPSKRRSIGSTRVHRARIRSLF